MMRLESETPRTDAVYCPEFGMLLRVDPEEGYRHAQELERELAGAKRDAARYRHLRAHWDDFSGYVSKDPGTWLDETIDAVLNVGST